MARLEGVRLPAEPQPRPAPAASERVEPAQALDAGDVAVGRAEHGAVFEGDGREARVAREVGRGAAGLQQVAEDGEEPRAGSEDDAARLAEPALGVRGRAGVDGVQQQVGVDQRHRPALISRTVSSSSSPSARRSALVKSMPVRNAMGRALPRSYRLPSVGSRTCRASCELRRPGAALIDRSLDRSLDRSGGIT